MAQQQVQPEGRGALRPEVTLTLMAVPGEMAIFMTAVVVALPVGGMVVVLMEVLASAAASVVVVVVGLEAQVLIIPVLVAVLEARLQLLLPEARLFFLIIGTLSRFSHTGGRTAKTITVIAIWADAGGVGGVGRLERHIYWLTVIFRSFPAV